MFNGSGNGATTADNRYQNTVITNDGFWPDINAGDFARLRGIPPAQSDERVAVALVNAMLSVNTQLTRLKTRYQQHGQTVSDESSVSLNGKSALMIQYQSAVFARAKADLLVDVATVNQKPAGDHLADRSLESKNELLAESERIIRNMNGKGRATVALL